MNDPKQRKFTIEIEEIVSLLLKASQRIIDDNLYPEDVLEKVALYKDNIFDKTNLLKMQGTVQENVSFKSNENFYSCFYERIVGKSEDYFQLDDVAVIISRKFGDQLLRFYKEKETSQSCLLYTSPSPRDGLLSRMPSSA